ncbi:hypothetical protein [Rhizobium terrae]|uniref:hypothetical protein n=1 Tax=Rhizobium terrae TaxID=2171756 RepID=UPI000E3C5855|nr:hypothetical protein [Rhizobium terrae]
MKLVAVTLSFALPFLALAPKATADEWGCTVLLCAASTNPSWHGVPECRPPMQKLISAMRRPGFSWPTCPEGGAGKPGYEKFAECPVGWTETSNETGSGDNAGNGELSRCMRQVNDCAGYNSDRQRPSSESQIQSVWGEGCQRTDYMARPLRDQPYFFDMRDEQTGTLTRFYFDLNL